MTDLAGHTIVVTGGARGLGEVLVHALVACGARVIIGDVLEREGKALARDLTKADKSVRFAPLDLAEPGSIEAFAKSVRSKEKTVDGLLNCAAIATGIGGKMFDEIDIDMWDRVMTVNVRGTWLVTRAFAPMLAASKRGRIVNVASDTALWGAPRLLAYVASKGAVIAMTRSLARELGPQQIGVTCIAPGILKTWSTEYVPEARHKLYEDGRAVPGPQQPEEIAATVAFLLSPGALTLTGQTLPVDNGFVFT